MSADAQRTAGNEATPTPAPDAAPPRQARWRANKLRHLATALLMPLVYAVNRPALAGLARGLYDVALRCNGAAIAYHGRHGLGMSEENFLRRHLSAGQRGVMLDVGANEGAYARRLRTLCPHAVIAAFEPHPATFNTLRANAAGLGIELHNAAMGASAGRLHLYDFADADGSTQASLNRDAVTLFSADIVEHDVAVTTVDDFMRDHAIAEIALLKIDTEGHDLEVLRGAAGAIARRAIAMIQFEFIPANVASRVFMRDFFAALPGYALHRMCLNGQLLPLPTYNTTHCEIFAVQNLVAIRIQS